MPHRAARIINLATALLVLCFNIMLNGLFMDQSRALAQESTTAELAYVTVQTTEQEAVPNVRVIITPIDNNGVLTNASAMYETDDRGSFGLSITMSDPVASQWHVAIDGLEWELKEQTIIDRDNTTIVVKPAPLNLRYQQALLRGRTAPASLIHVQLVDSNGTPVTHVRTVIERIDDAPQSSGPRTNTSIVHRIGDAYTNNNGEMFAVNDTPIAARSSTAYRIRLESNEWDVDNPIFEPSSGVQTITVSRYPIIFVPGIMGSYLDYENPEDGNKICNIWPTSVKLISLGSCKNVSVTQHGNLIQNISSSAIFPTDVIREQSGHLSPFIGNVYVNFLNKLAETWPEWNKDDDLDMGKKSLERCESVKSGVQAGNISADETLLFAFGYDWRQTTLSNAEKLSQVIECVQEIHENRRVNLVGHSMGGLVIKQLLLNFRDKTDIQSVSTFNTQYLGSVRAIQIMGDGEYGSVSDHILEKNRLKLVARNIPGAIELLPSNDLLHVLQKQTSPALKVDGKNISNPTQVWSELGKLFGSQVTQYQLRSEVSRDDNSSIAERTELIDYLILSSSITKSTLAHVSVRNFPIAGPTYWYSMNASGDGTVNEFSSQRVTKGIDWNPKTISGSRRVITKAYCNVNGWPGGLDHTQLVQHADAINKYIAFLKDPTGLIQNNNFTRCKDGNEILSLGTPVPTSPGSGFISSLGIWPTLEWSAGNNVDSPPFGYRIQVSTDVTFKKLIVDECTTNPRYPPPAAAFSKKYIQKLYWRVNYVPHSWFSFPPKPCKWRSPDQDTWSEVRNFTNSLAAASTSAVRPLPAANICAGCTLPRSDDGSSADAVALGFTVNFYDGLTDSVYVNTNGNLSFYEPVYEFRSDTIANNSNPLLAAFFADVDTRNRSSGVVTYGRQMINGRKAFLVNYTNVGYGENKADKRNTFQIVLINRSDRAPGDFDVEYNYAQISWETGDINGGTAGLGGDSVRVGFSSGQGDANWYEFPGSGTPGRFLDTNLTTGLTKTSRGSGGIKGRHVVQFRNGVGMLVATP